ncbi:hypothetical protein RISK_001685 [Rhodopirellula islandica]|uniref:Uncharacterized protein n=1 Tax=Rhodopirellula islandica TaxID=595434 RepID=A0A0J1ELS5_RHOIS|nr:hypothetical protein RISK_001685 [Rhodopirellula islandica]
MFVGRWISRNSVGCHLAKMAEFADPIHLIPFQSFHHRLTRETN